MGDLPKWEYGQRPVRFMAVRVRHRGAPEIILKDSSHRCGAQHILVDGDGRNVVVHKVASQPVQIANNRDGRHQTVDTNLIRIRGARLGRRWRRRWRSWWRRWCRWTLIAVRRRRWGGGGGATVAAVGRRRQEDIAMMVVMVEVGRITSIVAGCASRCRRTRRRRWRSMVRGRAPPHYHFGRTLCFINFAN